MSSPIKFEVVKSNGSFSIIKGPYSRKQHSNQQKGLDLYVDVLDHSTGHINRVKLYSNTKGLHFKKYGSHYLDEFDTDYAYVPFQMIEYDEYESRIADLCLDLDGNRSRIGHYISKSDLL